MTMKKCIFRILIITFLIICGTHYSSYVKAENNVEEDESITINTDILSEDFVNDFSPKGKVSKTTGVFLDTIIELTNRVLRFLQIIGGLATVLSVAFFGFNTLLSAEPDLTDDFRNAHNPQRNVDILRTARSVMIGAIILFSGSTIVRLVFNIFI